MHPMRRRGLEAALGVLAVVALGPVAAQAFVLLNELKVKGSEQVELYNSGPGPVDVNGWTIQGNDAHVIAGAPLISPGGYLIVNVAGDIFDDQGGFVELLDGVVPEDAVSYGRLGSAPLPPESTSLVAAPVSLARAPDGSFYGAPPTPSPGTDGLIWTLDLTPTFGAVNDAPAPALGGAIVLNEVDPKPVGGSDEVELYNPLAAGTSVVGWFLCNGSAFTTLSGLVPAGGFLTVTTDPGFDVEDNDLLYLFRDDGVRVDQLGFHLPPVRSSAPTLDVCQCFERFPDGAGPNLGYNWFTSGGNVTLFALECTPGSSNAFEEDCGPTSVSAPPFRSWGRIKSDWFR
ncbi:MAG: hypothetical protein DHS20C21_19500 [Gemmatimonadota bacterium]|nr:MAG: hypothetical protein DHS20C21_19500 [Gemmatimonadota bacterium]